jgi:LPS-assembly lipoprotein
MRLSKNFLPVRFSSRRVPHASACRTAPDGSGMSSLLKIAVMLPLLALTACGFHLRGSVSLPKGMERVHITVGGGGDFQRKLARALLASNVKVEDKPGPGIAELHVPAQNFQVQVLTVNGAAQVTEFAVRFHVVFTASDANGQTVAPTESIDLQREFSYDASQPIGTQSQMEQIEGSLIDDAVQALLFRLQAVAKNGEEAAAKAAGPLPAGASTTQQPTQYSTPFSSPSDNE